MLSFTTDGDFIDFKYTEDIYPYYVHQLERLHNSSKCITWGYGEDITTINFTIDDSTYDQIPITSIYFDGVQMSVQNDFKTNIESMFPGLTGGSYKVYTALLTQSGILDPIVTVPTGGNTLGASVTWTRASEGVYDGRVPINGIFNDDSKVAIPGFGWGSGTGVYNIIGAPFTDAYTVFTYSDINGDGIIEVIFVDSTGAVKDLSAIANINIYIEIRVYQ